MRIKKEVYEPEWWTINLAGLLLQQAVAYAIDTVFIKRIDYVGNTLWGIALFIALFLLTGTED